MSTAPTIVEDQPWLRWSSAWRLSTWWLPDGKANAHESLLRLLALAHRERMAVTPLVRSLSAEHRYGSRHRLLSLAQRLEDGSGLLEALEQTPDVLADEQVLTLRFGNEMGVLSEAYEELLARTMQRGQQTGVRVRQALAYAVVIGLAALLVLSFLMVFIAPTFKYMFEEFGLELPAPFRWLISTSDYLAQFMFPGTIALVLVIVVLGWLIHPLRIFRRTLASRTLKPVAEARVAQLLRLLAMAIDAGRPVSAALSTLARYHFDRNLRHKLLFVRNEVEQGAIPWNSLHSAGVISEADAQALQEVSSSSMRSWLMRRMAELKEQQGWQRTAVWSILLHPAIVLTYGVMVAWVCVAFFSVLVTMISSLA